MIPKVSKESILQSLEKFDREQRETSEWQGWEDNKAHKYAIDVKGQHYPVKQIISLATGVPVSEFSGGGRVQGRLTDIFKSWDSRLLPCIPEILPGHVTS